MIKRIIAALLTLSMLLALGACGGAFSKEYLSVAEYMGEANRDFGSDYSEISDYGALKTAIMSMIMNNKTEGRLKFIRYDGVLTSDLARACREVQFDTALGSFAVDYLQHNVNRIITYDEATINIFYRRAPEDIRGIRHASGPTELKNGIEEALGGFETGFAFWISSSSLSREAVLEMIERIHHQNPALCVLAPAAGVTIHPEGGYHRIIEFDIDYGMEAEELKELQTELVGRIAALGEGLGSSGNSGMDFAREAFDIIMQNSMYDPDGEKRREAGFIRPKLGSTAYGALVEGYADAMGLALAFNLLLETAGIESRIVTEIADDEERLFNIILIEGEYYLVNIPFGIVLEPFERAAEAAAVN